jgi:pseudouridine synthase
MSVVLQKFIADSGTCSRRKAEEMIRLGTVTVNGLAAELGMKVEMTDEVKILGKKIELAKTKVYIKLNKPEGVASTSTKVKGEKNVFDLVRTKERLFIVGRLDKNSRGLVLLTNDGELTQTITHPSFEHEKKYLVRISPCNVESQTIIDQFKIGLDIGDGDGVVYAKQVRYLGNYRFEIVLTCGKKRQIRRMFKVLGCEVIDLLRTHIADLKLGSLKEGKWEYLNEKEIEELKKLK